MDIKDLLFSLNKPCKPGAGSLLISEPLMEDPYFARSVILLLDEPDDGGHFGLMINKLTSVTLKDLMPDWEYGHRIPIYCGGPVDMDRLFLIHNLGSRLGPCVEVIPGIFVGADIDQVISYLEEGGEAEGHLRFFLGYCGWSPGQLSAELSANTWTVNPHPDGAGLLNGNGVSYWRKEVRQLGEDYRSWLVVPENPSFN